MVETSDRIMDMVRRELKENPAVENAVLFEKAMQLDPEAMKDVDKRQFHARYPLRIKRFELNPPKKGAPRRRRRAPAKREAAVAPAPAPSAPAPPSARGNGREAVRGVLLRFAQDLAKAESRGDIVQVIAGVDTYVEEILGVKN